MEFLKTEGSVAKFSNGLLSVPPNSAAKVLFVHGNESAGKKIELGENSSLEIYTVYKDGSRISNSITVGGGAKIEITDIFSTGAKINSEIIIEKPDSRISLVAKGTVNAGGFSSYRAMARIGAKAHGADADLEEHAYLLGKGAKAELLPGFDIRNNDVKARHASSMSELDSEQIFYLMSRGISQEEAKKEIVSGFLAKETERIKELFGYAIEL